MTLHEPHPKLETIRRYCDGSLPDFEQVSLESHLAECEECMGMMNRMDSLLESGFSAAAHAAALEAEAKAADPLARAIRQAAGAYREFAAELHRWLAGAAALWGDVPVRNLGQVGLVPVSGSAASRPIRVTLLAGESRASIDVRESGRILEVASDAPIGTLALLFSTGEEPSIYVAVLQAEGAARVARFDRIQPGLYCLAIAPIEENPR